MGTIHDGHRQRLKQRFVKEGLTSFESHNILELLLFYALPRQDTNVIAHELIDNFKTLTGVFNAPYEELIKVKGLGENGATLIKLIPQLLSAYTVETNANQPMNDVRRICNYFHGLYIGVKTEKIHVCCLDDKLNIISCVLIQDGGVNTVPINVRKIVEATYRSNSSMIILSHNHPNGIPIPSDADIVATRKLYKILDSVGIKLLDHIVASPKSAVSMKYAGYFDFFEI